MVTDAIKQKQKQVSEYSDPWSMQGLWHQPPHSQKSVHKFDFPEA